MPQRHVIESRLRGSVESKLRSVVRVHARMTVVIKMVVTINYCDGGDDMAMC